MITFKTASKPQRSLIRTKAKTKNTIFLEGPAGTGKTTVAVERMVYLLEKEVTDASKMLVLVPQKTLALPYYERLRQSDLPPGGQPSVMTLGSLSEQMVEFFWPLIAAEAGFAQPAQPPVFLTLETAQYYMARIVAPLIDQLGYFDTITIERNRLYSQILDAISKSALIGFDHTEVGQRLSNAWIGEESQKRVYGELQTCINKFREYCLDHNLLDFSLQIEVFLRHLWPLAQCRNYLMAKYTYLIVDNIEEDTPATHALLREWLPECESALLVYDSDAGYRRFLGADPDSAYELKDLCKRKETFTETFVTSLDLQAFGDQMALSLDQWAEPNVGDPRAPLVFANVRFQPEMIQWAADEIANLVHGEAQVPPGEIVVLAPYLSDALRFSLMNRLQEYEVPVRSHRPSRSLNEEAAVRALLTLTLIAHPQWGLLPTPSDVAHALILSIEGLDLVRAQLLAQIVYRTPEQRPTLTPFEDILPDVQERITYRLGNQYERLRAWLDEYRDAMAQMDEEAAYNMTLDAFLSRLFGELLSQEGFGLHRDFDGAAQVANLIDSARRFRQVVLPGEKPLAQEYVELLRAGLIAGQYVRGWELEAEQAVLIAPAYTFLMRNVPVQYQFWLNVGGAGWSERLYQPLTHPYVLSQGWQPGHVWTDDNEYAVEREALYRLVLGLIRRCRETIFLGYSELGEQGYEQRGELLASIQRMLRRLTPPEEASA
ncbi:MAG: AAA family ATPase [Anaerolineae bacterium]|nr:AAA family ATPase [Anaerolineae bacterium]